jgi:glycosyltransferase involved in cell wall biosynthesis
VAVARVGERLDHPAHPAISVGDPVLARALRSRFPDAALHENLWGVHGEDIERPEATADRAVALLMLVDGSSPAYLDSALRGLAAACRRDERLLVFVNTERARGHVVWKMARRLGLSDRLSLIPDAEARREAILNLDGLVIAEPGGVLRSMALDAMACGMPVIAAADPALGTYVAGVTAKLISRPDPRAWEEAVAGLASGSQEFVHLRTSASSWVASNRSASTHVAGVLRMYDGVIAARQQASHVPAP